MKITSRTTEEAIAIANRFIFEYKIQDEDLKQDIVLESLKHRSTVSERAVRMHFFDKLESFIEDASKRANQVSLGVVVPSGIFDLKKSSLVVTVF